MYGIFTNIDLINDPNLGKNSIHGSSGICIYTYTGWWFQPVWKIWKSIGMMTFQIYGKIKVMFQSPPTSIYIYISNILCICIYCIYIYIYHIYIYIYILMLFQFSWPCFSAPWLSPWAISRKMPTATWAAGETRNDHCLNLEITIGKWWLMDEHVKFTIEKWWWMGFYMGFLGIWCIWRYILCTMWGPKTL